MYWYKSRSCAQFNAHVGTGALVPLIFEHSHEIFIMCFNLRRKNEEEIR